MKNLIWIAAAALTLNACGLPTAQDLYGKGPLPNRAMINQGYAEYMKRNTPGYFFVAEDGSTYGYSYCSISGSCSGMEMRLAQDACLQNSRGARCFIYARDGKIVWDENAPPPSKVVPAKGQ